MAVFEKAELRALHVCKSVLLFALVLEIRVAFNTQNTNMTWSFKKFI